MARTMGRYDDCYELGKKIRRDYIMIEAVAWSMLREDIERDTKAIMTKIAKEIDRKYDTYKYDGFMYIKINIGQYNLAQIRKEDIEKLAKEKLGNCRVTDETNFLEPYIHYIRIADNNFNKEGL